MAHGYQGVHMIVTRDHVTGETNTREERFARAHGFRCPHPSWQKDVVDGEDTNYHGGYGAMWGG